MSTDQTAPCANTTHDGRPVAPGPDPAVEPEPTTGQAERQPSLVLLLSGVAVALFFGVLLGLWARPELIGVPSAQAPARVSGGAQIPLAHAPPAKTEPPRAPDRLQTLPPSMAAAADAQALSREASTGDPVPAAEPAREPRYAASFDCATARPGAEEMVCEDPALAAADRRLARAYERAMRSGADPEDLRQEQRDWTAIREDAALNSPRALAQVYDQRIEELNHIADTAVGGE